MRCDLANPLLVEFADGELPPQQHAEIAEHLDTCAACQTDFAGISQWRAMANNWHEETPPPWQPPKVADQSLASFFDSFRMWFPTFASAAALAMVTLLFVQQPDQLNNGMLPTTSTTSQGNYSHLPPLPKATQAAMVQSVLDSSRDERGMEIQALLKLLKAEMDKRSIETEESLRYIIKHQLRSQEELDELYDRVDGLMTTQATPGAPFTPQATPQAVRDALAPQEDTQ